jgi:hypothetical protein
VVGSAGGRDLLRQNVGQMQRNERDAEAAHQGGQDRVSGSFGSLMMLGYDQEGSMVRKSPLSSAMVAERC